MVITLVSVFSKMRKTLVTTYHRVRIMSNVLKIYSIIQRQQIVWIVKKYNLVVNKSYTTKDRNQ